MTQIPSTPSVMQPADISLVLQTPDHAQGLFSALSDPRVYTHLNEAPPPSVKAVKERIHRLRAGPVEGYERWLNWSVFLGGVSGEKTGKKIVGYTQATVTDEATAITARIAYVFSPHVWGRGVAQVAVEKMLEELVQTHNVTCFVADTEIGNLASQNLLGRLGFHVAHREGEDVFFAWGK